MPAHDRTIFYPLFSSFQCGKSLDVAFDVADAAGGAVSAIFISLLSPTLPLTLLFREPRSTPIYAPPMCPNIYIYIFPAHSQVFWPGR